MKEQRNMSKEKPKRKILAVLTLTMVLATLCGCNGKEPDYSDPEVYEYTHINVLFEQFWSADMPIGDYSYGTGNDNPYGDKFNKDCPIATVYVSPYATDEIIDMYAEDVRQFDSILGANKKYLKYAKKNKPYFVTLECEGEVLESVDMTGNADIETLKQSLREKIAPRRETAEAQIQEFEEYLKTVDGIQVDDKGQYYFVMDSHNLTESANEIIKTADEIRSHYPIDDENASQWVDSFRVMGYPGGTYMVYLNEYGKEPISIYRDDGVMYSLPAIWLYRAAYDECVMEDYTFDKGMSSYYWVSVDEATKQWKMSAGLTKEGVDPVTEEEIYDDLYKLYDNIITKHEEHEIVIDSSIDFYVDIIMSKDNPSMYFSVRKEIPLDRRYTREEFITAVKETAEYYDLNDYEQPDDCR